MDSELFRMQQQADCFSHVHLSRTKQPHQNPKTQSSADSTLLLGLILILLTDGGDMLTIMMLLYILST